jgi:hypothetical protein
MGSAYTGPISVYVNPCKAKRLTNMRSPKRRLQSIRITRNRVIGGANDYITRTWNCTVNGTQSSVLGDGYSALFCYHGSRRRCFGPGGSPAFAEASCSVTFICGFKHYKTGCKKLTIFSPVWSGMSR